MELRHLRYFLAVAGTLNISEASRRLRVAQPSLSRQIRDLEEEVGHPLFHRRKGRLFLTPAGAALQVSARRVLEEAEAAMTAARKAATEAGGELSVGYYGMMWATVVAPALQRFQRLHPGVRVRLLAESSPAQLASGLAQGELDLAVLGPGDAVRSRQFIAKKIISLQALLALPQDHHKAGRRAVALAELRQETFLSYSEAVAPGRDRVFEKTCRAAGFKPRILREAPNLPALLLGVAAGRGVAVVSPFATRAPHPGVVFARIKRPGVIFDIHVAHGRNAPETVQKLAEIIAAITRKMEHDDTSKFQ